MTILSWVLFNALIIGLLCLDLFVLHKGNKAVHFKEALVWSGFWIGLSLLFNLFLYFWLGPQPAMQFLAGYLIEKSLSVDNLFVFLVIFKFFQVKPEYQPKILFWGILVALIMRGAFILGGIALIERFSWLIYIFGFFLIYTGFKLGVSHDKEVDPSQNLIYRISSKLLPISKGDHNGHYMVKENGKWMFTNLFIVLLVINWIDLVFALDSIPAVFAVTMDPFIVYTSNVFAILGLRALYFAIAGLLTMFVYLNYGLAVILVFVGVKMLASEFIHLPIAFTLLFITIVLGASILFSIYFPKRTS